MKKLWVGVLLGALWAAVGVAQSADRSQPKTQANTEVEELSENNFAIENVETPTPTTVPSLSNEPIGKIPDSEKVPRSQYSVKADEYLDGINGMMRDALRQSGDPQVTKDPVRNVCVNDRVSAMKALVRIAQDAYSDLQEALAFNAHETADRSFTKLWESHRRVSELYTNMRSCMGERTSYSGGGTTQITFDGDFKLPESTMDYFDRNGNPVDGAQTDMFMADIGGSGAFGEDGFNQPQTASRTR